MKVLALLAAVLMAVAGCQSDPDPYTPPPTRPSTPSSSPPPVTAKAQVLGVEDLPPGWSVSTKGAKARQALPPCFASATSTTKADSRASVAFAQNGSSPFLLESVGKYTPTSARRVYTAAQKKLDKCKSIEFKVKKIKVTGSMSVTSFPDVGEMSRAYTATESLGGAHVTLYLLVVRRGSQFASFVYGSTANADITAFVPFARAGADHLHRS